MQEQRKETQYSLSVLKHASFGSEVSGIEVRRRMPRRRQGQVSGSLVVTVVVAQLKRPLHANLDLAFKEAHKS